MRLRSQPAFRATALAALCVASAALPALAQADFAVGPEATLGAHARDLAAHRDAADLWAQGLSPQRFAADAGSDGGTSVPQLGYRIYGYLPYWSTVDAGFRWDLVSDLIVFSAQLTPSGTISSWHGWPNASFVQAAHAHGVRVQIAASLFNSGAGGQITTFLASATAQQAAITALVNSVKTVGGDGISYDFEFVPSSQRAKYTAFVQATQAALSAAEPGAEVSIAMPPSIANYPGYDFPGLAASARLLIMNYDYHWASAPNTGPVAPLTSGNFWGEADETDLQAIVAAVPPGQVVMGIPYYGYDWAAASNLRAAATSGSGAAVLYSSAYTNAQTHGRLWDTDSQTPWYRYQTSAGVWHQCWYDDAQSAAAKYQFLKSIHLAGAMIWALGYDGARTEMWDAIETELGAAVPPVTSTGPLLRIESVTFVPSALRVGEDLTATFTVKNVGDQPAPAVAPPSGTLYDETQDATSPISGSFRVALDVDDRAPSRMAHPWRWGLAAPLAPGAEATIEGVLRVENPGARTFSAALIQEGLGTLQDSLSPTLIDVSPALDAGPSDGGAADGGANDAGQVDAGADGGDGSTGASSGGCQQVGGGAPLMLVLAWLALRGLRREWAERSQ